MTPDVEKDYYPRGANRPFEEQAFVALGWMRGSIVIEEKKKELRRTGMINNSVSRGGIIISQRNRAGKPACYSIDIDPSHPIGRIFGVKA